MRTEFSARIKVDAYRRSGGKCEICGQSLQVGKIHYDHIVPDQLGGEATLDNCQAVCVGCHKEKTKDDVGRISKAKRQERRHIGVRKQSRFPGSRDSPWKKTIDGRVVRR